MHQKYVVLNKKQVILINSLTRRTCANSVLINASEVCGVKQKTGDSDQFFNQKNLCKQCSHQKYVVLNKKQVILINYLTRRTCANSVLINASEVCGVKQKTGDSDQFFNQKNLCKQCSNQCIRSMWC